MTDINFIANSVLGDDTRDDNQSFRNPNRPIPREKPSQSSVNRRTGIIESEQSSSTVINGIDYSLPGPQERANKLHCQACDVWIGGCILKNGEYPRAWHDHLRGIQHRRQLLSIREHGARNKLVLSVFEGEPTKLNKHLIAGKSADKFDIAQLKSQEHDIKHASNSHFYTIYRNTCNAVQVSLVATGIRTTTFNEHMNAMARLAKCVELFLQQQQEEEKNIANSTITFEGEYRNECCAIACSNFDRFLSKVTSMTLDMEYITVQPQPIVCLHTCLAGYLNCRNDSLESLRVRCMYRVYVGGLYISTCAWGELSRILKQIFETKVKLTHFDLELDAYHNMDHPPAQFLRDVDKIQADFLEFVNISKSRAVPRRMAFLMGLHTRLGEDSAVRCLPMDAIKKILEDAYPSDTGICNISIVVKGRK